MSGKSPRQTGGRQGLSGACGRDCPRVTRGRRTFPACGKAAQRAQTRELARPDSPAQSRPSRTHARGRDEEERAGRAPSPCTCPGGSDAAVSADTAHQGPGDAVTAALAGRGEASCACHSPCFGRLGSLLLREPLSPRTGAGNVGQGNRHWEASRDLWVDLLPIQGRVPGPANSPATPIKCVLSVQGSTGPATAGDGAGWRPRNRVAGPALLASSHTRSLQRRASSGREPCLALPFSSSTRSGRNQVTRRHLVGMARPPKPGSRCPPKRTLPRPLLWPQRGNLTTGGVFRASLKTTHHSGSSVPFVRPPKPLAGSFPSGGPEPGLPTQVRRGRKYYHPTVLRGTWMPTSDWGTPGPGGLAHPDW